MKINPQKRKKVMFKIMVSCSDIMDGESNINSVNLPNLLYLSFYFDRHW